VNVCAEQQLLLINSKREGFQLLTTGPPLPAATLPSHLLLLPSASGSWYVSNEHIHGKVMAKRICNELTQS